MKGYADLHSMPEDARIKLIGRAALLHTEPGKAVGCILERDDVKVERYCAKLRAEFPDQLDIELKPGPVAGTTLLLVKKKV